MHHMKGRKEYHNSGGEMVLLGAHLQASGHHQPLDAAVYRSVIVRFKGWSLHLICLYIVSNYGLDAGPNEARTQAVANLIRSIGLPWLLVGDF